MANERPREDDEESGGQSAAPSGGGGRLRFLRRLTSAPALLKRAQRPATFGGAIVMLVALTWMLWQLVASTTALNASVETLAGEVQKWAAAPAPDAVAERSAEDQADDESPVVTLLGKPVLTGGADMWNCVHFESWEQADLVYRANWPLDPNILDFDGNGVPCESLPGAP